MAPLYAYLCCSVLGAAGLGRWPVLLPPLSPLLVPLPARQPRRVGLVGCVACLLAKGTAGKCDLHKRREYAPGAVPCLLTFYTAARTAVCGPRDTAVLRPGFRNSSRRKSFSRSGFGSLNLAGAPGWLPDHSQLLGPGVASRRQSPDRSSPSLRGICPEGAEFDGFENQKPSSTDLRHCTVPLAGQIRSPLLFDMSLLHKILHFIYLHRHTSFVCIRYSFSGACLIWGGVPKLTMSAHFVPSV